jgi:hypothetical protein
MRTGLGPLLITAGLLATPLLSLAQLSKPNPVSCPKGAFENDDQWIRRCAQEDEDQAKQQSDARSRAMTQQLAATERQRAALEKQPPLAPARNRLIGRWQSAAPKPAANADPFAQLLSLTKGCGVLIGDGIVEFQPDGWAIHDGDGRNDLGAISYRGGAKGEVFGLPAKGSIFNLLPFEFETPNRIHLIGVACTLVRSDATPVAPVPGVSRAKPAAAVPLAAAPAPAPTAPRAGLGTIKDRVGYQCPDGQQLAVQSCFSEAPEADCLVVRVDQPPRNGLEVTFIDTRAALIKRVAGCTQRGLALKEGVLVLAP